MHAMLPSRVEKAHSLDRLRRPFHQSGRRLLFSDSIIDFIKHCNVHGSHQSYALIYCFPISKTLQLVPSG
jgi:hypothetical protein